MTNTPLTGDIESPMETEDNIYMKHNFTFGDVMIDKDKWMPRLLYQNISDLELSTVGFVLEIVCDYVLNKYVDVGSFIKTNNYWNHRISNAKLLLVTKKLRGIQP